MTHYARFVAELILYWGSDIETFLGIEITPIALAFRVSAFDRDDIFNITMMLKFPRTQYQFEDTLLILVTVRKWGSLIDGI